MENFVIDNLTAEAEDNAQASPLTKRYDPWTATPIDEADLGFGTPAAKSPHRETVYLCLGSDKLIFDCLGPLVGSLLLSAPAFNGYVYGSMAEPVTALQVESAVRFIRRFHFGASITVVDSAVGKSEEVGKIKFFDRGLRPALGVDREMRIVGDKSIMGIVTTKDKIKDLNKCDVKLSSVYAMAKKISSLILSRA